MRRKLVKDLHQRLSEPLCAERDFFVCAYLLQTLFRVTRQSLASFKAYLPAKQLLLASTVVGFSALLRRFLIPLGVQEGRETRRRVRNESWKNKAAAAMPA